MAVTKWRIAWLVGPSFQEGSGSPWARAAVAESVARAAILGTGSFPPLARDFGHPLHHPVKVGARGFPPGRELPEAREPLGRERPRRRLKEGAVDHPLVAEDAFVAAFIGVGAQVAELWHAKVGEPARPDVDAGMLPRLEDVLPVS
jgi:hypothetical protein